MLVLSRKKGEGIAIGQDIVIEILGIDNDRVRIGILAPSNVRIFRRELLDQTVSVNKAAVSTPVVNFRKAPDKPAE